MISTITTLDQEDKGKFIYSNSEGARPAFVFQGDEGFLRRAEILIDNFSDRERRVLNFDPYTKYIYIKELTIKNILQRYYCSVASAPISATDEEIDEIARQKMERFWMERVERKFFNLFNPADKLYQYKLTKSYNKFKDNFWFPER